MAGKVMTGARAVVFMDDPATNTSRAVGIFTDCSWGVSYGVETIFVLGSYGPVESIYTSMDATTLTCSGYRVIDHGPHIEGAVPKLADLLHHEYVSMTCLDRQTNKTLAKFRSARPAGYNTALAHRQPESCTVTYIALRCDDESVQNDETPDTNATSLP
jgi:hypothetical protein